jgi:uncharacterized membrane-anchored protein
VAAERDVGVTIMAEKITSPADAEVAAFLDEITDELIKVVERLHERTRRDVDAAIAELRCRASELEVRLLARDAEGRERLTAMEGDLELLRQRLDWAEDAERSARPRLGRGVQ